MSQASRAPPKPPGNVTPNVAPSGKGADATTQPGSAKGGKKWERLTIPTKGKGSDPKLEFDWLGLSEKLTVAAGRKGEDVRWCKNAVLREQCKSSNCQYEHNVPRNVNIKNFAKQGSWPTNAVKTHT